MAFELRCPSCEKRYSAEWRMVGKRIRCRRCAHVFEVPSPPESEPVAAAASASIAEGITDLHATVSAAAHATAAKSPGKAPVLSKPVVVPQAEDDPLAMLESGPIQETVVLRTSRPQDFPGSRIVERWAPVAVAAIGIAWALSEAFREDHSGRLWVPAVRVAVATMLFLLISVPITLRAVKETLKQLNQAPPPDPGRRCAMTFAMPAALGFVLWQVTGTSFSFFQGLIVGLLVAGGLFWLLFRQDWKESAQSFGIAAAAFVVSAALGMGVLLGLNYALNQVLIAAHSADKFQESPLGAPLAWVAPASPLRAVVAVKPRPRVQPAAPPVTNPPQVAQASVPASPPVQTTAPPSSATVSHAAASDPPIDSALFSNAKSRPASTAADPEPFVDHILQAHLPFVILAASIDMEEYTALASPLTPSEHVGVVINDGTGLLMESCTLRPFHRNGVRDLYNDASPSIDARPSLEGHYAISPDGAEMLRLTSFPSQVIEINAFERNVRQQRLPLESIGRFKLESPELLGALPGKRALVRWKHDQSDWLELWDYGAKRKLCRTQVVPHNHTPGTLAVDPAGQWVAVAARDLLAGKPEIALYHIGASGRDGIVPSRALKVEALDAQWQVDPAQIAFSPDGKKVAALFEHDIEGFIVSWNVEDGKEETEVECPVRIAAALAKAGREGRVFDWLDNRTWLVHGGMLLDASTGVPLATLTEDLVTGQQVVNDHTVYLSFPGTGGRSRLAIVKFDRDRLASSARGAKGKS